jgi:SAM-dependent methyltransferase
VLEVGSGDGRSFEHYPPEVTALLAVEPDPSARESAAELARTAGVPIEIVDGLAERLPADDGSFDAVVVMGVLCSVADPRVVLQELRRVLREGGELRFWEHVRSGNAAFREVQRAVDRLFWTRALGGCETTRDTLAAVEAAGFEIDWVDHGFHSSSPVVSVNVSASKISSSGSSPSIRAWSSAVMVGGTARWSPSPLSRTMATISSTKRAFPPDAAVIRSRASAPRSRSPNPLPERRGSRPLDGRDEERDETRLPAPERHLESPHNCASLPADSLRRKRL